MEEEWEKDVEDYGEGEGEKDSIPAPPYKLPGPIVDCGVWKNYKVQWSSEALDWPEL